MAQLYRGLDVRDIVSLVDIFGKAAVLFDEVARSRSTQHPLHRSGLLSRGPFNPGIAASDFFHPRVSASFCVGSLPSCAVRARSSSCTYSWRRRVTTLWTSSLAWRPRRLLLPSAVSLISQA